jgi:uridine kinase
MSSRQKSFETPTYSQDLEQPIEVERQFTTDHPAVFEHMKESENFELITHIYLSHPDEEFNLRVSEVVAGRSAAYYATLKDRGQLTDGGIKRIEIETEVSEAAFRFYEEQNSYAMLRKFRVRPASGVTIDWYATDEPPVIEVEDSPNKQDAESFLRQFSPFLLEYTGHQSVSSEALAYRMSPDIQRTVSENISADTIVETILATRAAGAGPIVAGIMGRSGSGKTTLAREVAERLSGDRNEPLTVTCLSSDDYHRGKSWLEVYNSGHPWQNWDSSIVYDTVAMAADITKLTKGMTIPRRVYNFSSQEPAIEGIVTPNDIILIEGICSGSQDMAEVRDLMFSLSTPPATSIGRRLKRDVTEGRLNNSLGTVADILRYQIEYAEPAHLSRIAD